MFPGKVKSPPRVRWGCSLFFSVYIISKQFFLLPFSPKLGEGIEKRNVAKNSRKKMEKGQGFGSWKKQKPLQKEKHTRKELMVHVKWRACDYTTSCKVIVITVWGIQIPF